MISEAISKIQQMAEAAMAVVKEVHGVPHFVSSTGAKPIKPDDPDQCVCPTLQGLVSWLEGPEYAAECGNYIIVDGHNSVSIRAASNEYGQSFCLAHARHSEQVFPFGTYLDQEEFIIRFQTSFMDTAEKKSLIDMVGRIAGEEVLQSEDDGIAQTVTVVDKLHRKENKDVEPIVNLTPRRTFSEVVQPQSPFLIRMRKGRSGPEIALFEADSGQWKVQAARNIAKFLRDNETVKASKIHVIG
jgi:hypothetical protein